MDDPGYGLTFRRDGDGLRAEVVGERNLRNTVAYWEGIVAQVAERRPRWLLVCDRLRGEEPAIHEWHALVDRMRGKGLEGIRIAHVKPYGVDHVEYCEIFAREAGIDARAFRDERSADRWLRYGVDDAA